MCIFLKQNLNKTWRLEICLQAKSSGYIWTLGHFWSLGHISNFNPGINLALRCHVNRVMNHWLLVGNYTCRKLYLSETILVRNKNQWDSRASLNIARDNHGTKIVICNCFKKYCFILWIFDLFDKYTIVAYILSNFLNYTGKSCL